MRASPGRTAVVVAAQVAILAAIPIGVVKARLTGREITLATRPVDPFDPFVGHHVRLSYAAEVPRAGQAAASFARDERVWVTVERGAPAWRLVSISRDKPAPAPDRVSLRARWEYGSARIDSAGRLYLPKDRARRADLALQEASRRQWKELAEVQRRDGQRAADALRATLPPLGLVDLRVDDGGDVALLRLRVGALVFEG